MHALLQHYEESHVRFEEDEDDDLLIAAGGFTDDDGWSTHSESAPNSPQMGASRQLKNAFNSNASANAAAAATVAALTAASAKLTPLSFLNTTMKKKATGVSLSDIYSEESAFFPDEAVSAFPNSILRTAAQANQASQVGKKRDLASFSSSFDTLSPLSKKAAMLHNTSISTSNSVNNNKSNAAAALTVASIMGDLQPLSKTGNITNGSIPASGAQDDIMNTVTGYLDHAIQHGLLPNCGEVGSPAYLLAAEELLRKRDEIVSMMESIGRSSSSGADKPYRCTVSGCDKAYKNANGLKYHNQHGHCSLPGSSDDDKSNAKPYRCTFLDCGKCYKNLNGLKYHIEHSHPHLAAILHANIPAIAALDGSNASQAAITAAAAVAAVRGDSVMMSAINAIMTSSANNSNRSTPLSLLDHTPDSSPNSSPILGPSTVATPAASPMLVRANIASFGLSIQTTKDTSKFTGLMTPASPSPTSATVPKLPNGSHVSTLTAALAAVAVEQQRA
ncbi:Transcriptional regulator of ribosomal biogenesis protein [Mortierella polycephala]|uniref:Transcriptional regulator of ribosomal biogenesis protein n=1 Tax=Mortierella polycephala TaxID=41804 RepID=A0A9P6QFW5_9FUNG|nr:Transcriptional regulator of ribosomal biogenesis protein [Mortierella polycephala]